MKVDFKVDIFAQINQIINICYLKKINLCPINDFLLFSKSFRSCSIIFSHQLVTLCDVTLRDVGRVRSHAACPWSRSETRQASRYLSGCCNTGSFSQSLLFLLSANCNHINHAAAFELLNIIRTFMFTICLNGAPLQR